MANDVALSEQALEVELHYLGLKNTLEQALTKAIKRPQEWMDRQRDRMAVAKAACETLRRLEEREAL